MSITGRPLSTKTIVKRLRHVRDNSLVDYPDQARAVDKMGNLLLDIPIDQQTPTNLRHMVRDLTIIVNDCTMSAAEHKLLGTVLDNMEHRLEQLGQSKTSTMKQRMNASAKAIDPVALIEVPNGKPEWMLANEAAEMTVVSSTKARSTSAIIGAIDVILEEVGCGAGDSDAFDTLHHLIDVLERLVN